MNHIFAGLAMALSVVLTFMSLLLLHFKDQVALPQVDAEGDPEAPYHAAKG